MDNLAQSYTKRGAYGEVRLKGNYAIKYIPYAKYNSAVIEIALLTRLHSEYVVCLDKISFKKLGVCLSLKRADCDLEEFIKRKPDINTKLEIERQIFKAVDFIHKNGIIHADLKPQNILIETTGTADISIKICDFGISIALIEDFHAAPVQTINYRAPEMPNKSIKKPTYTEKIDIWSIGCILFYIYYGKNLMRYEENINDSTIYACKLLKITTIGSRTERLNRLLSVSRKQMKRAIIYYICERMDIDFENCHKIPELFIHVGRISKLLHMDPCKRPSAGSIIDSKYKPIPLFTAKAIDELQIINYLSEDLLNKINIEALQLADNIFVKIDLIDIPLLQPGPNMVKINKQRKKKIAFSSLYVASCVYSTELDIDLTTELLEQTSYIIKTLGGKLLW